MGNSNQKTASEILTNLGREAFDEDQIPSASEARRILETEGIDIPSLNEWALTKLQGVKSRQKLVQARATRISLLEKLETYRIAVIQKGGVLRENVMAKLNSLGEISPDRAQAFCHRFEEASEEDLADIEAELLMLDLHAEEFGNE